MKEREHGQEKIQRSRDHRRFEAADAGLTYEQVGRELVVSKHTIYAWKAEYGGMNVSEAQRLRQLEDENGRLKKLVAELSLDKEERCQHFSL